jgi:hypothetical protein
MIVEKPGNLLDSNLKIGAGIMWSQSYFELNT